MLWIVGSSQLLRRAGKPTSSAKNGSPCRLAPDRRAAHPMPTTELSAAKSALRKAVLARRAAIAPDVAEQAAQIAADRMRGLLERWPVGAISAFRSFGDEIGTTPLLAALDQAGYRIGLPIVMGKGKPLAFRLWRPGDSMAPGPYGIEQPLASAPEVEPDILIVPMAAFDVAGYRIGYGGGFYDRSLERLRAIKPVVAIGLAYDEQQVDAVPRGDYDARLDHLVTPTRTLSFGA
jgi:5-formyltetrahydrofolate cyclo-ligase